jgi:hypothetical protein
MRISHYMPKRAPRRERWFSVTLLFCSSIDESPNLRPLCEERIVLFRGNSEKAIRHTAGLYGQSEMISYKNCYGETVNWKFLGIEELEELEPPKRGRGWEVGSRHVRRSARELRRRRKL